MPERLGEIISGLRGGISATLKNCRLLALWERVVDKRVIQHTEPLKIKNRTLYISAASPVWAQELSYLKKEIIGRFNQAAGEEIISDIRFKAIGGDA